MKSSAWTDIFIYPGYRFKAMDALITNFHLPESTLVMLVSAFARPGKDPERLQHRRPGALPLLLLRRCDVYFVILRKLYYYSRVKLWNITNR